jgi:hypothetical protein
MGDKNLLARVRDKDGEAGHEQNDVREWPVGQDPVTAALYNPPPVQQGRGAFSVC